VYLTEPSSAEEGGTALAVTGGVPLGIKVTFILKREGRPLPYGETNVVRDVALKFSYTQLRK
jgi:hypothetical protein